MIVTNSTPHSIISDYLVAKEFANNWKSHIKGYLVNSLYDIWLYSSNFIKDDEREDFLSLMMSFDLSLGAKISKKFGNNFIEKVEKTLLENEQSNEVLKRSEAIYALGILGTGMCLERLRSKEYYRDYHHEGQRTRSLAVHGDKETLYKILKKNEQQAQYPMKISGGTYSIWFNSSPTVITDIARSRLDEWIENKEIPLAFCLETISLFGDSYDIDVLVSIIENTKVYKEFNNACIALNSINTDSLITLLKRLIFDKHFSSYNAKKILLSCGFKSDIDDEFNYFIEQCAKSEAELINDMIMHNLYDLVRFIVNFELNDLQRGKLIEAYKKLRFRHDFYIYNLIWEISSKNKAGFFLPIVELAFSRNYSEEIRHSMCYLSSLDKLKISDVLLEKINDYFPCVEEENYRLRFNYIKYYLKQEKKEIAHKIIYADIEKLLIDLSPETISYEKYYFSTIGIVFHYFDIDKNIKTDELITLKLLLIDTSSTLKEDKIKKEILGKIGINKIEDYANKIEDIDVKIHLSDYLLKNDFTLNPVEIIEQYLPTFLSHHMYYSTIQKVCEDNWNDELSAIFLSCFHNHTWTSINVQMFDEYISFYADILTKAQLGKFEEERNKPINPLVDRIYRIWLESNGLS